MAAAWEEVGIVQLTAQQFNDVLVCLEQANRALSDADQRRHGRMDVHAKVAAAVIVDNKMAKQYSAIACDISIGGIGLYQSEEAAAGAVLLLRLPGPGKLTVAMVCTVVHCRMLADGIFGVGAAFVKEAVANAGQSSG
ncbi:MAG: PilZ domain-containing protein [Tepidisphaerales bacterium]